MNFLNVPSELIIASIKELENFRKNKPDCEQIADFIFQNTAIIAIANLEVYLTTTELERQEISEKNRLFDYSVIGEGFRSIVDEILRRAINVKKSDVIIREVITDDDINMIWRILAACLTIRGIEW